jgi:UDPglucose 6-dehydrogenase
MDSRNKQFGSAPTVSVIGLGYVGLTTAAALAARGFPVRGYDVDRRRVEGINAGVVPFHEPGLERLLKEALSHRFRADLRLGKADLYFITVGTPCKADGSVDLSYVKKASSAVASALRQGRGYRLVVVKSTVPPGTTEGLVASTIQRESGRAFGPDLGLVMNPEFLRQGSAVEDTLKPDRLVIGERSRRDGDYLERVYSRFLGSSLPVVVRTSPINAELIKYANNAFLATKVSFINMIANLCQELPGADVGAVSLGIGVDRRIGPDFLRAGAGWGGSCWPKDLKALTRACEKVGVDSSILDAAAKINEEQPMRLVRLAKRSMGSLRDKKVALLGLSFKPDTDDMREAVSIRLVDALIDEGACAVAYDPAAMPNARRILENKVELARSASDALRGADGAILVTEWKEFTKLTPQDFALMKNPIVIDGRRALEWRRLAGVRYSAIGTGDAEEGGWKAPSLAVNAIIEGSGKVYLLRRNEEPFRGMLSLPGGYVEYGETAEDALRREVLEETGLEVRRSKLVGVYSSPKRHPKKHVVALLYSVKWKGKPKASGFENSEGGFFGFESLGEGLAFDHHEMLRDYYGHRR